MAIKPGKTEGSRVVDDPFELRELATMVPTGVLVGYSDKGVFEAEVTSHRVVLFAWDGDEDWIRPWSRLQREEKKHRFELAFLLTMEWRAQEGEWLSLLDGMARA